MSTEPRYLVQDATGDLHGYWNLDVLLVDVAINREASIRIYVLNPCLGRVRYTQVTLAQLREMAA